MSRRDEDAVVVSLVGAAGAVVCDVVRWVSVSLPVVAGVLVQGHFAGDRPPHRHGVVKRG